MYRARFGWLAVFLLWCSWVGALEVEYRLSMPRPVDHYFHVEMRLSGVESDTVDLAMPAWSPGRYLIFDFARNVRSFSAETPSGSAEFRKLDKQTWRVETGGAQTLTARYQVYADNLSGDYSQLNHRHAFINGPSVFLYVKGRQDAPCTLEVDVPPGWDILGSAGERGQRRFEFPNYDRMVDEPIQLGRFSLRAFHVEETEFRVCIFPEWGGAERERDVEAFVHRIQRIAETAVTMLGPLDTDRYTFFFHFLPDTRNTAGMEHLNSTQITREHQLDGPPHLMDWTYWIAAHEVIHAWNGKRLRPLGLGPFDYSREVYTPLLWLVEGVTNYLAHLIMIRSGLWDDNAFYARLSDSVQRFRSTPGIHERSAEEASFDTWLWNPHAKGDWNPERVWMSYYLRGELIALCMDMEIRRRTDGRQRIEDFLRLMYERFYQNVESESYYLQGRGYETEDVLRALEDTAGGDWTGFYTRLIARAGDIPLEEYLIHVGMELYPEEIGTPTPYTGLNLGTAPGGFTQVNWLDPHSPAERAGFARREIGRAHV